jgi:adenosylcobinamide-phosphate synthase
VPQPAWQVAAGLVAGLAADALLGDPRRLHPVAGFGTVAGALERRVHRDSRPVGAAYSAGLTATVAALGAAAVAARSPQQLVGLTALATWAVVGGTSLRREAATMSALLEAGDLDGARQRLSHLCGRDPSGLDAAGLARATVESVAENTSDAVVGPLVWGAVAGVPGLLAYRAVNTLDAMVGHRSPRYARFGWAAARTDDLANLLPAVHVTRSGPGDVTAASTPARTPDPSRPPSPGRWAGRSAAGCRTPDGSRSGRCLETARRPRWPTSPGRPGCQRP